MFRKLFTAVLLAVALATAAASVPGLLENVAHANCNASDPTCG